MQKWNILNKYDKGKNFIKLLLENRGLTNEKEIAEFMDPPNIQYWLKQLPQTFKQSLKLAKVIVEESIEKDIPIVIYGDYDADGICATTILFSVIKNELKHEKTISFIPNRFDHGYGLSKESIDEVLNVLNQHFGETKNALMITVDTGITAVEEIAYAKSKGFKVILTDHHQQPEVLPNADALVWDDSVVGSMVSWFLGKILGSQDKQSLGLAAIATVTDLYPILGINRTIVKEGLRILNSTPPRGVKELLEVAGQLGKEITTYQLGWVIGPRLNATGRLVDASTSLKLMLAPDNSIAKDLAGKLNEINIQRQDKTMEMYELAADINEENPPRVIVSSHQDYHEGIIGLVASKLVQKHYRPSIVISITDEFGKGSARSIRGVNIIEMLREFDDLFENLGGHPMAAGFSINVANIEKLKNSLESYALQNIDDELLVPVLDIDLEIPLNIVNMAFFEEIDSMKPFGIGNKEPVFVSKSVGVTGLRVIGRDGTHLSLQLYYEGQTFKAIFFGGAHYAEELKEGDLIDVVYSVNKNEFNGRTSVDLIVKDLHLNTTPAL